MPTASAAMQGRFHSDTFTADVVEVAKKLVPLSVHQWNKLSIEFPYLFNMRELSKVPLSVPVCAACCKREVQQETPCYKHPVRVAVCCVQQVFNKWVTLEDIVWISGAIRELCKCNIVPDLAKQVNPTLIAPASH